ncbi:hypothetical protein JCM10212_005277 [Sporobolomyces blumeae]
MCGRFALGIQAGDVAHRLESDYFQRHDQPDREDRSRFGRDDDGHDEPTTHESGSPAPTRASSAVGTAAGDRSEEASHGGRLRDVGRRRIRWRSTDASDSWLPRFNVAPKTGGIVVVRSDVERRPRHNDDDAGAAGDETYTLDVFKWGLVPHWTAKPADDPPSTINAQMESVFEGRPTWRGARESQRCIVVAQGFYEWLAKGKSKVPHFVQRRDGKLMVFAGLWDHCSYKGEFAPVTSYTIITTPVNKQLEFLHNRMPAILDSTHEIETWLSPRPFDDKVKRLIRPFEGELDVYAVDQRVGKVGNESPDFIKPVAQKKGSLDSLFAKQQVKQVVETSPSRPIRARSSNDRKSSRDGDVSKRGQEEHEEEEEKEEEGDDDLVMNPDEDTKSRTDEFERSSRSTLTDEGTTVKTRERDEREARGGRRRRDAGTGRSKRQRDSDGEEDGSNLLRDDESKIKPGYVETIELSSSSSSSSPSSSPSDAEGARGDERASPSGSRKNSSQRGSTRSKKQDEPEAHSSQKKKKDKGGKVVKKRKKEQRDGDDDHHDGSRDKLKTDGQGNVKIDGFFKKLD